MGEVSYLIPKYVLIFIFSITELAKLTCGPVLLLKYIIAESIRLIILHHLIIMCGCTQFHTTGMLPFSILRFLVYTIEFIRLVLYNNDYIIKIWNRFSRRKKRLKSNYYKLILWAQNEKCRIFLYERRVFGKINIQLSILHFFRNP